MFNFKKIALYISAMLFLTTPLQIQPRSLTVICGSMCSGKTEEFILMVSRFLVANFTKIGVFKPCLDTRILANNEKDPACFISSRNGSSVKCMAVMNVAEMKKIVIEKDCSIIAIDEAQFFNKEELLAFVREMLALDKKIIVSGLDLDFRAETFGAMGDLLAMANDVVKLTAICTECGNDTYCITQRIIDGIPAHYNDPIIMVGDIQYTPRCRHCHVIRKD